jgi:hypothetical protein
MSLVWTRADWLWIDFALAVFAGFIVGTGCVEFIDSVLFWIDRRRRSEVIER